MKPIDDITLKKSLTDAYHAAPAVEITQQWQQDTMRKIRSMDALNRKHWTSDAFQALVWKMAPVFCILLVLMITGMFSMDLSFESLVRDSFIDDPVVVIYNGIFWG